MSLLYHINEPVLESGNLSKAKKVIILLHGRGAGAADIMSLAQALKLPKSIYLVAPEATHAVWYPYSLTQSTEKNQPHLQLAIKTIHHLVTDLTTKFDRQQLYLLGFSQGACLALEYGARYPQKYGGIFSLSGGLLGQDQELTQHSGDLQLTSTYFSGSQDDPYIPQSRINRSIEIFEKLNAQVSTNIYPEPGHSVTSSELSAVRQLVIKEELNV